MTRVGTSYLKSNKEDVFAEMPGQGKPHIPYKHENMKVEKVKEGRRKQHQPTIDQFPEW